MTPSPERAQQRDKGADRRERPAHIGGQHRVDQIVVERFEIVVRHHPGKSRGIDQDVGAAEAVLDRRGDLADLGAVFQRQVHRLVATARQLGDQRRRPVGSLVVADDDLRPRAGEEPHACRADAAAAAGHDRDLAGERIGSCRCSFPAPMSLDLAARSLGWNWPAEPHDFGQQRVEAVGRFVCTQWPAPGIISKRGLRLDLAQRLRALVEIGIGGGVAPAPDAVDPRLDPRKRLASVSAREKRRLLTRPRGAFVVLDIDRQLVDLCGSAIISAPRLCRATARISASEAPRQALRFSSVGWRTRPSPFEPTIVKPSHPIAEQCRDMAAEHPAEREAGKVQRTPTRQHDVEAVDDDPRQALGGMRLGRGRRLAEPRQIGGDDGKLARQRQDIADPMRPRAIAAMQTGPAAARFPSAARPCCRRRKGSRSVPPRPPRPRRRRRFFR